MTSILSCGAWASFLLFASTLFAEDISESFSKSFDSAGVTQLVVKANRGHIAVTGNDSDALSVTWEIDYNTAELEEVEKMRNKLSYDAKIVDNSCIVDFVYDTVSGWGWIWGDDKPLFKIEVSVPKTVDLQLDTLGGRIQVENIIGDCDVKTSGGRIEIEDVVGDVVAKTSGGRVDLEDIEGNAIVKSSGGPIDIEDLEGEIQAKTSGGSISIEGGKKRVIAETTGGSIRVECPDPEVERIELNTMGGSVRIEIDERVGGTIDLKTQGDSVSIDDHWAFSGDEKGHAKKGTIGQGNAIIIGYTLGGSVRLDTL